MPLLLQVLNLNLRVSHVDPVKVLSHEHWFGATQVPPFLQLRLHTAKGGRNENHTINCTKFESMIYSVDFKCTSHMKIWKRYIIEKRNCKTISLISS